MLGAIAMRFELFAALLGLPVLMVEIYVLPCIEATVTVFYFCAPWKLEVASRA